MAVTLKLTEETNSRSLFFMRVTIVKPWWMILWRDSQSPRPTELRDLLYNCINRGYYSLARTRMGWLIFNQLERMLSATSWVCASVLYFSKGD